MPSQTKNPYQLSLFGEKRLQESSCYHSNHVLFSSLTHLNPCPPARLRIYLGPCVQRYEYPHLGLLLSIKHKCTFPQRFLKQISTCTDFSPSCGTAAHNTWLVCYAIMAKALISVSDRTRKASRIITSDRTPRLRDLTIFQVQQGH